MRGGELRVKIADTGDEFDRIARLNYATFVEEIPQHQSNPDRALVDKFHQENTYFIAKEGEADAIAEILQSLVRPSMAEPGMKFFMPYRSPDNPAEFIVYELYENRAGWDAHNAAPHFLNAVDALVAKAAFRERIPYLPFVA